jgi:Leucine-rich repeat (LRR) protein
VSGNQISDVPSILHFPSLFELNLSMNQLTGTFPMLPLLLPKLTTLILSDNKISSLNMKFLSPLSHQLQILDLTNNDLLKIPNELGYFICLKSLGLEGNPFKIPRRQVVQAGLQSLMNYFKMQLGE